MQQMRHPRRLRHRGVATQQLTAGSRVGGAASFSGRRRRVVRFAREGPPKARTAPAPPASRWGALARALLDDLTEPPAQPVDRLVDGWVQRSRDRGRSGGEQLPEGRVLPRGYAHGRWPYDDSDPLLEPGSSATEQQHNRASHRGS